MVPLVVQPAVTTSSGTMCSEDDQNGRVNRKDRKELQMGLFGRKPSPAFCFAITNNEGLAGRLVGDLQDLKVEDLDTLKANNCPAPELIERFRRAFPAGDVALLAEYEGAGGTTMVGEFMKILDEISRPSGRLFVVTMNTTLRGFIDHFSGFCRLLGPSDYDAMRSPSRSANGVWG